MIRSVCRAILGFALLVPGLAAAAETRQEVAMPAPMRDHMLANMRDHLHSLDEILAALGRGDRGGAADIAESRLGMSSLVAHGAEHMAAFMPAPMREIGTSLHHAASRFAITVRDAEFDPPEPASRKTFAALHEIMAACDGCHSSFRLK